MFTLKFTLKLHEVLCLSGDCKCLAYSSISVEPLNVTVSQRRTSVTAARVTMGAPVRTSSRTTRVPVPLATPDATVRQVCNLLRSSWL